MPTFIVASSGAAHAPQIVRASRGAVALIKELAPADARLKWCKVNAPSPSPEAARRRADAGRCTWSSKPPVIRKR